MKFRLHDLPPLGGSISSGSAMTRLADGTLLVVGFDTEEDCQRAVRWRDFEPERLEGLERYNECAAIAVHSDGTAVGNCGDYLDALNANAAEQMTMGVLWAPGETEPRILVPMDGHDSTHAACIGPDKKQGLVCGRSFASQVPLECRAAFWPVGNTDICIDFARPDDTDRWPSTRVLARSSSGLAVGYASNGPTSSTAAFWGTETGKVVIKELPVPEASMFAITDGGIALMLLAEVAGGPRSFGGMIFEHEAPPTPFVVNGPIAPSGDLPVIQEVNGSVWFVWNGKQTEGTDAGTPECFLFVAEDPTQLDEAAPKALHELVELPPGWDRLCNISEITRDGWMVGEGMFQDQPRGFVLEPLD